MRILRQFSIANEAIRQRPPRIEKHNDPLSRLAGTTDFLFPAARGLIALWCATAFPRRAICTLSLPLPLALFFPLSAHLTRPQHTAWLLAGCNERATVPATRKRSRGPHRVLNALSWLGSNGVSLSLRGSSHRDRWPTDSILRSTFRGLDYSQIEGLGTSVAVLGVYCGSLIEELAARGVAPPSLPISNKLKKLYIKLLPWLKIKKRRLIEKYIFSHNK